MAIVKLLSGHPDGRATVDELKADLAFFNSVGVEWTSRMKRLAARAPSLDIFAERLVLRDKAGWQLTTTGREFLDSIEAAERIRLSANVPASRVLLVANPLAEVIRLDLYRRKLVKNARRRLRKVAHPEAGGDVALLAIPPSNVQR